VVCRVARAGKSAPVDTWGLVDRWTLVGKEARAGSLQRAALLARAVRPPPGDSRRQGGAVPVEQPATERVGQEAAPAGQVEWLAQ
jgi:hypothetical protein